MALPTDQSTIDALNIVISYLGEEDGMALYDRCIAAGFVGMQLDYMLTKMMKREKGAPFPEMPGAVTPPPLPPLPEPDAEGRRVPYIPQWIPE
jgi:hypothetical protein